MSQPPTRPPTPVVSPWSGLTLHEQVAQKREDPTLYKLKYMIHKKQTKSYSTKLAAWNKAKLAAWNKSVKIKGGLRSMR